MVTIGIKDSQVNPPGIMALKGCILGTLTADLQIMLC